MNHLKIASPGFQSYTGNLGATEFVDGISVEPVPRIFANRLSAAMMMVEVHADGTEVDASVAHRLILASEDRAVITPELPRQTPEEKAAERRIVLLKSTTAPVDTFYTRAELDELVKSDGIKGLRAIGEKWGVKHRSAVILLETILAKQSEFIMARDAKLSATPKENFDTETPAEDVEPDAFIKAAITGDLSVALTEITGSWIDTESITAHHILASDLLNGSSVLASTYEIADETVQLGTIVTSAFTLFGGTAKEWNDLENDAREDLLRAELDRRLAAV